MPGEGEGGGEREGCGLSTSEEEAGWGGAVSAVAIIVG
jgi:hypothetical protein